ncbi:uncharacterized protein ACNLHF_016924 [Anomaloglossus baeobatrachus]
MAEFAFNNRVHQSTGTTPFFCNYGYNPHFGQFSRLDSWCPGADSAVQQLEEVWREVRHNVEVALGRQKRSADKRRSVGFNFQVGNKVWLSTKNIHLRIPSTKLGPKFIGPYEIIEIVNPVAFRLRLPQSFRISNVFHKSLLKPFVPSVSECPHPPPPVSVDGQMEHEIERIIDSRRVRSSLQYLGTSLRDSTDRNIERFARSAFEAAGAALSPAFAAVWVAKTMVTWADTLRRGLCSQSGDPELVNMAAQIALAVFIGGSRDLAIQGVILKAICTFSENMLKSVILSLVTCCLLSAFPGSKGSKINGSLSCVMQYQEYIVTCSWSESRRSRQLVNMSLAEKNERPFCQKMEPVSFTETHLIWTCHRNFSWPSLPLYSYIDFAFLPDRSLESHLNVSIEGDEAKPKNLRCQDSGDQMIICFWEVRQEVADSVDFNLYYRNDSGKEEACQPRCWLEIPAHLSCSCNFTAGQPNISMQFRNIRVRPTDPENSYMHFRICKNIKLPPRGLIVEEKIEGETFEISWKNNTIIEEYFNNHYEVCYWKENDMKPKKVAFDCPGDAKLQTNDFIVLNLGVQLQPSSNYSVKVRVRLGEKNPDHCYQGPWSEWSNVQTLHTKSVPNIIMLSILVLSSVIVLVIFAVCGCKTLVRYKKQWDDKIPNPNKSSIIKSLQKAKKEKDRLVIRYLTLQNGSSVSYEEHLYVEPYHKVSMWAPSKDDTSLLKEEEDEMIQPHSEWIQHDDSQCLFLFNETKEEYPTTSLIDDYKPFAELIDEQETRHPEGPQINVCAFDGPYLFS